MHRDDEPGDALDDVNQIHPALDRLRQLLTSATILDLKATADGYWADHSGAGNLANPSERYGRPRQP